MNSTKNLSKNMLSSPQQQSTQYDIMQIVDTLNIDEYMRLKQIKDYLESKWTDPQGNPREPLYYEKGDIQYWYGYYVDSNNELKRKKCQTAKEVYEWMYSFYLSQNDTVMVTFQNRNNTYLTENTIKEATWKRNNQFYNQFINEDFGSKAVNDITLDELKSYTLALVKRVKMTQKGFKAYKGVLNMIFPKQLTAKIKINTYLDYLINKNDSNESPCEYEMFTQEQVDAIRKEAWSRIDRNNYNANSFAILLASYTGMRIGELFALHWSDIQWYKNVIHIHRQQLSTSNRKDDYYEVPYTKNEVHSTGRGIGREFPLTDDILYILKKLKEYQEELGINSEYVFCNVDGSWKLSNTYVNYLYYLCKDLGIPITKNHAFRKYVNSLIFIPLGIEVNKRAALLGHTVETNLKYYTLAPNDTAEEARQLLNKANLTNTSDNIIDYAQLRKSQIL